MVTFWLVLVDILKEGDMMAHSDPQRERVFVTSTSQTELSITSLFWRHTHTAPLQPLNLSPIP